MGRCSREKSWEEVEVSKLRVDFQEGFAADEVEIKVVLNLRRLQHFKRHLWDTPKNSFRAGKQCCGGGRERESDEALGTRRSRGRRRRLELEEARDRQLPARCQPRW